LYHPERVTRLITIASSPKWVSALDWPGISTETLEKFSQLLMSDYRKTLEDFLELQLRGAPKNSEIIHTLYKQIKLDNENALMGGLTLLRTLDLRSELNIMQCPSLHIFGSNDTLVPIGVVKKIESLLPHGKFNIFRRAGHIPFLSHQDIFINEVFAFLSDL
jgi:pimeloyl-[acyl-carrier protein] methyl ester esterase